MPLVIRRVTQARWFRDVIRPWLQKGEIPADPLADLRTTKNSLSVYLVDDDKSNLDRVICALAATREKIQHFDYLLFDWEILPSTGITVEPTEGETIDRAVNELHRDLVELSGRKLLALAAEILHSEYETGRFLKKKVNELIDQAAKAGRITVDDLPEPIRASISPD